MTKDEIFSKVKETLIREFALDPDKIKPEALLSQDLDLDSLDEVDLLSHIRDFVPNAVDPDLFNDIHTVQELTDTLFAMT